MDAPLTTQDQTESEQHVKNGMIISFTLMLIAVVLGIFRTFIPVQVDAETVLTLPWAGGLFGIGAVGFYFSWRRRLQAAAYFLLTSLLLIVLALALRFDGAATSLSGSFTAAQVAILLLIVPSKQNIRNIFVVLVANTLVLVLDQFGADSRIAVPSSLIQTFNWMTIVSLLALFVFGLRNFVYYSIRYKIFIAILAGSILSVIVISLSVNFTTNRSLIQSSGSDLKQIAEREALSFGELIIQEVKILQTLTLNQIAQNEALVQNARYDGTVAEIEAELRKKDADWDAASPDDIIVRRVTRTQLSDLLRQFQNRFPNHIEVVAADKHGGLVGSTAKPEDFYQGDQAWWQAAYNNGTGGIYIGNPEFDKGMGEYGIKIAVPIYGPDDEQNSSAPEIVGVLRTTYSLDNLDELLSGVFEGPISTDRAEFYLGDEFRLVVSVNGSVQIEDVTNAERDALSSYLQSGEDAQLVEFKQGGVSEEMLISTAPVRTHEPNSAINDLEWHIVVMRPQSDVLAAVGQQSRNTILLSVGAVIASAVAAVVLGRALTGPIVELTHAARRIEAGDRLIRATIDSNDELGEMASAINHMMDELNLSVEMREQRIAERTQALVVATEVGRELTSILDLEALLFSVVNKVNHAFDYYHVQIYLWNKDRSRLVMHQGTGSIGEALLAKQHAIESGQGVVGRAAVTKSPLFVQDVRGAARPDFWLPNPLLPDTVSEAAVPILVGDDVIGVLDVQDDVPGKMSEEDIDILQIVTGQISVAIQNAKLYTVSRQRAETEAMILEINRKIQATTTVESAMKTAVVELGKRMGTKTKIVLATPTAPSNGEPSNEP